MAKLSLLLALVAVSLSPTESFARNTSIPNDSVASSDVAIDSFSAAAAREWWLAVAGPAAAESPPRAGRSAVVFTHVPKTGGGTVSFMSPCRTRAQGGVTPTVSFYVAMLALAKDRR